eukprot:GILK01007417.1.p1 GENE.GILK01007417.1~~GILK01007417.1.p1  ORF type:complete len:450 (-),score=49.40 GILK01007417.1:147-1496(-)
MQVQTFSSNAIKKERRTDSVLRLSLYLEPPREDITLEEFESFAMDRVQVLKGIETAMSRGSRGEELASFIDQLLKKSNLDVFSSDVQTVMRRDQISHFITRLAYCHSEDLRRWFLAQEARLFRHRFERETHEGRRLFMEKYRLNYLPIDERELERVRSKLSAVHNGDIGQGFYKVAFEEALSLISKRQVYLEAGFAFVPRDQLSTIIGSRFRASLSKSLSVAHKALPHVMGDERIAPLLRNLSKQYVGQDFTQTGNTAKISLDQLDTFAMRSYPPCMRNLHEHLRENHHLRYFGRLQYGVFLKGIGLAMEDSLAFWRSELTQKMSVDKFEKEYAYNIRYSYGKEGKRQDHTPWSCNRILNVSTPGPGEHHGCVFKNFDENHLSAYLSKLRVGAAEAKEIVDKASKEHHYQIACLKLFEATHKGCSTENVGNHPNAYFEASKAFYEQPRT